MVQFKFHWRDDIRNFMAQRQQPVMLLPRPKGGGLEAGQSHIYGISKVAPTGTFLTPKSPFNVETIDWASQDRGDFVSIPLWSYDIAEQSRSLLVGSAVELGLRAAVSLAMLTGGRPPLECHMILGNECFQVDKGYRFFLGATFRID